MRLPALDLVDRLAGYMQDFPEGRIKTAGMDLAALAEDVESLIDWIPISFVSERTQRLGRQRLVEAVRSAAREQQATHADVRTIR